MNAPIRFALVALTGLCLSLTLAARTASAAFIVDEIRLQYTLTDANGNTIIPPGTQIVNLINGRTMPTDPNSPLAGKSISDAQMDFADFTGPNSPFVGLLSLAGSGVFPKFALGTFFWDDGASGSVLFQMSQNAVVINPSAGMVSGFNVDTALTLDPADDHVTGQAAGNPDFSMFYGGGTAHFLFDPTIVLDGSGDGTISGFGNVTVTLTPSVPEPASVASLLVALGLIGAGVTARRVRSYFRPSTLNA
jgi:hypothetical protein